MSIDISIGSKLFGKKPLPLEVILGDELQYGGVSGELTIPGEMGDGWFIAFHPDHYARGISVTWTPEEVKQVELLLPQPSAPAEYDDLYAMVERIMLYWGGKLEVDGNKMSLPEFLSGKEDMIDFNRRTIAQMAGDILDGRHETLTFISAQHPLVVGREEAERFAADPDAFPAWLHERQCVQAEFANGYYYMDKDTGKPFGLFTVCGDFDFILPGEEPTLPFGATDPTTGGPLECDDFRVVLMMYGSQEAIAVIPYSEFYAKLPKDKLTRFDGQRVLMAALSEAELRALYGEG